MSSPDSTKKRRVATGNNGGGRGDDNGLDDGTTMSTILAKLNDMQSELDTCLSSRDAMQEEMDGMQSRLSHMDELENKCDTLEKKCTTLETRCDSLQRSVQILSKESTWEYSASSIPLSHWRGLPEDYVASMETLLADIKSCTCQLRSGNVGNSTVYLGQINSDIFLQHDDVLLPHWKELANALQLYNMDRCTLKIANIQLTSEVLDLLAPALKGKPITEFRLERNEFVNNEGIRLITEYIKQNKELQHVDWINNQIDNTKDAMLLVDAIVNHPSITKVRIENSLRGGDMNSYEVVRPLFASDTRWDQLDLEGNNIQTKGDTAIPDYIASNPPLKKLYLAGNKLNDDDTTLIARALRGNTNLKNLRIHNNTGITDIGLNALYNVFYDVTSLNSISDCNHACWIEDIEYDIPDSIDNNPLYTVKQTKARKIYYYLSRKHVEGSNVQNLNLEFDDEDDASLKIVPQVLAAIQHYHDDTQVTPYHPLSITYEVLRGWKMPELYEKRS